MNRRSCVILGLFLVGLLRGEITFETWQSQDGRTLEAMILGTTDDTVTMKRRDGVEFTLPIRKFAAADQSRIREWTPPPMEWITPQEAVFVIESPGGRGTGFLVAADQQAWLYTNQHVIDDPANLRVIGPKGQRLELGKLEIAVDRDLARFEVEGRSGLRLAKEATHGDSVVVYGNSRGTGHITEDKGSVIGLSPTEIEVDADIVAGNSGGPIVNEQNEVIAVSAYVLFANPGGGDATIEGTRFEEARRFGLLINQRIPFREVSIEDYAEAQKIYQSAVRDTEEVFRAISTVDKKPTNLIVASAFTNRDIEKEAERYNRKLKRSGGRALADNVIDFFEDTAEISAVSVERAIEKLDGTVYGWMHQDLTRRQKRIAAVRERIEQLEDTYK